MVDFLNLWINCGLLNTIKIKYNIINQRNVAINLYGQKIWLNCEKSSVYHILNSVCKIKKIVDSIPIQNKCDTIIDIGGNCGLFSCFARQRFPHAKIYVFEPSPDLQDILHLNLGVDKKVKILPLAISDQCHITNLFINKFSQQTNSLIKENVEIVSNDIVVNKVQAITLDSFIKDNNIEKVDILKIDVQGAEKLVIDGATQTLDKTRFLVLEVSFLDTNVFSLIEKVRKVFELSETINPVLYGADIIFHKKNC